ncbi:MAG: hypothetical protein ABH868_04020 [bacterium]
MKKVVLTSFLLMIIMQVSYALADVVVVKVEEANIAESPEGESIGVIKEGTPCESIYEEGAWTKINVEAWVKTSDITLIKMGTEKEEIKKEDYAKLTPSKLKSEGFFDSYDKRRITFRGNLGTVYKNNDKVANHVNFTVSSVNCFIRTRDVEKIKDFKKGDSVRVYGQVKREPGGGEHEKYYIQVNDIIKE